MSVLKSLFFPIILTCFAYSTSLNAQFYPEYETAIGVRFGSPFWAASYKTFLTERNAVEGYIGYRDFNNASWVSVSAAYQRHHSLHRLTNGLLWYYGGGSSLYFWNFDSNFNTDAAGTSVGLNAYAGLDYRLTNTRVVFSVDIVPVFFLNGLSSGFEWDHGGIGIRYVLK